MLRGLSILLDESLGAGFIARTLAFGHIVLMLGDKVAVEYPLFALASASLGHTTRLLHARRLADVKINVSDNVGATKYIVCSCVNDAGRHCNVIVWSRDGDDPFLEFVGAVR